MKLNLFSVFKDSQAGRIKTAHQKTPQNKSMRMNSFNMSPMVLSGMVYISKERSKELFRLMTV